jgi:hypothetical protein
MSTLETLKGHSWHWINYLMLRDKSFPFVSLLTEQHVKVFFFFIYIKINYTLIPQLILAIEAKVVKASAN